MVYRSEKEEARRLEMTMEIVPRVHIIVISSSRFGGQLGGSFVPTPI